jgi:hypothetical protein
LVSDQRDDELGGSAQWLCPSEFHYTSSDELSISIRSRRHSSEIFSVSKPPIEWLPHLLSDSNSQNPSDRYLTCHLIRISSSRLVLLVICGRSEYPVHRVHGSFRPDYSKPGSQPRICASRIAFRLNYCFICSSEGSPVSLRDSPIWLLCVFRLTSQKTCAKLRITRYFGGCLSFACVFRLQVFQSGICHVFAYFDLKFMLA